MKKIAYFLYAWSTTFLFVGLLFWLATVPNFLDNQGQNEELIKVVYRLVLYGILFLLLYRSIITTFRYTIDRLSKWRSEEEKLEDAEFVLIIETLITIIAILLSIIIATVEEIIQSPFGLGIEGRNFEVKDILISTLGALLTGIIVYTMPIIGEVEITFKNKVKKLLANRTSK